MCLVHRGIIVLLFFFFASQFHYKGLTCCCRERSRRAAEPELSKSVSILCDHHCMCFMGISLEMDGLIHMERQKLPFTIENILSKYPNSNGDRKSCGTCSTGVKEKAVSPVGGHAEAVHHACLCCCYCSHCGDIYQTDFINEGKTKPILFMKRVTAVDTFESGFDFSNAYFAP